VDDGATTNTGHSFSRYLRANEVANGRISEQFHSGEGITERIEAPRMFPHSECTTSRETYRYSTISAYENGRFSECARSLNKARNGAPVIAIGRVIATYSFYVHTRRYSSRKSATFVRTVRPPRLSIRRILRKRSPIIDAHD